MKLEEITAGQSLTGIESEAIVQVITPVRISPDTVQLIYKLQDGTIRETLMDRGREDSIAVATAESPWSFDGDGEAFKLAVEAKRIDLAFLFDPMMAVHTSNVEPLPHQITAVYESLLPRQPLRFVLADDPGAGKTIMAGLYIRELIMRADARRILIVAPGSLVDQWRDELFEKFGLEFPVYSRELEASSPSGNPFENHERIIARLDQMARNEELQEKLCSDTWDLVVFDEAHKLSAHYFGSELKKTGRFRFGEKVGGHTRHLLLMTATPHNRKEEDFQLFLSLLDSDRFYGKFRDGVHKVDPSDLMRRMVKEELVKFDGTPLFPERRAYTINYKLSDLEAEMYEAVTQYVTREMGKAEARRLQPFFVRSFFMKAFETLGGLIYPRERDRWEITYVPGVLRDRDRQITGRNRRDSTPALRAYERVCFTKEAVRLDDKPNAPMAVMLHPGHPLMLTASDVILERHANLLRQGAILVDPTDAGEEPSLLFLLTHEVRSGEGAVLSKRLQFVRVDREGKAEFAGWAPHLDLEPIEDTDQTLFQDLLSADLLNASLDQKALELAATTLVPEHYNEVAQRRIAQVDKTLRAVNERLKKEISFWSDRFIKLTDDRAAGKDVRLNLENVRRIINDLKTRLEARKKSLRAMRHVTSFTQEPDYGVASINYDLGELLKKSHNSL